MNLADFRPVWTRWLGTVVRPLLTFVNVFLSLQSSAQLGMVWRTLCFRMSDAGPPEVQTEHLRTLFRDNVASSPVCALIAVFLYVAAPEQALGTIALYWVACNVAYQCVRFAVGVAGLNRMRSGALDAADLRRWNRAVVMLHGFDGALMLALALFIHPALTPLEQSILTMVVMVITAAMSFNIAGRWAAVLVYAVPTHLGFAWASWHADHSYARLAATLVLGVLCIYVYQAYVMRRSNVHALMLAAHHRQLAQTLQAKNAQCSALVSERSRLLATVSHDLRQPAHAIGLLCERALIDSSPGAMDRALGDLHELSQSLSASLTTLMDLTRLESGLVKPVSAPLALAQVLQRLEAEFESLARHKGLALSVPTTPLWVRSDAVLLHGVLANLLSNAIKYTRQGRVDLTLEVHDRQVRVAVHDTGMGIEPGKLEAIFQEFVRLEGGSRSADGLGLGLSIVKRYADLLGHPLFVRSQPQRGSCFGIALPLEQPPGPASAPADPGPGKLTGLEVLVVDNVDLVLSSMSSTLSAWDCRVHAARSLAEACELAKAVRFDLIISDFHLGDGEPDGLALIGALRSTSGPTGRTLPALLMTGDVSSALENAAAAQRVELLHKPVRPSVLQASLLHLLSGTGSGPLERPAPT